MLSAVTQDRQPGRNTEEKSEQPGIRLGKVKALAEPNLAKDVRGNKKNSYRCVNDKRKPRESVAPLQKEMKDQVTWGMEKGH